LESYNFVPVPDKEYRLWTRANNGYYAGMIRARDIQRKHHENLAS